MTAFLIFLFTFVVYLASSFAKETPYNYFVLLSNAFLHGHLYLSQSYPWLNELIPGGGNKYFVVYPPMPAILLMPLVFLFGANASQTVFSVFLGSVNVALVYLLSGRLTLSGKTRFLVTILFGFGTNHWYLASVGSAWYLAHITALFFFLLALTETFGKQRLFLIGVLLGASFWARTTIIFTAPFFYIYFWKKFWPINRKNIYHFLLLHLGVVFFIFLDMLYNFLRFGHFSPLSPYQLIPGIANDPIFQQGFMSLSYIPRHLKAVFIELPVFRPVPPFLVPSLYSTALWFTTPALVFILKAGKNILTFACWVGIISCFLVISLWGGIGFSQFGYRFAQDFMPLLLILVGLGIGQKPSSWAYLLVILSILVNLWGVVMINGFQLGAI